MASNVRSCVSNGAEIQRLRMNKGLSVEKLAEMARVSVGTIGNLERGQRVFLCTIRRVAEALHVNCEQLLAVPLDPPLPIKNSPIDVTVKFSISYEALDQAEAFVARIEQLVELMCVPGLIEVTKIMSGSVRVTMQMDLMDVVLFVLFIHRRFLYSRESFQLELNALDLIGIQLDSPSNSLILNSPAMISINIDLDWMFTASIEEITRDEQRTHHRALLLALETIVLEAQSTETITILRKPIEIAFRRYFRRIHRFKLRHRSPSSFPTSQTDSPPE